MSVVIGILGVAGTAQAQSPASPSANGRAPWVEVPPPPPDSPLAYTPWLFSPTARDLPTRTVPPPALAPVVRQPLRPFQRCEDPQRPARIFAETLAGTVTSASAFLLIAYFAQEARTLEGAMLGLFGGMMAHFALTPAAVALTGSALEGNGRYWAALLGNLLLPVAGAVIGYELSHAPPCDLSSTEGVPMARRPLPSASPLRASPVLAPNLTGTGGGTVGVAITF